MTDTIAISGSPERASRLVAALRSSGHRIEIAQGPAELAALPAGSLAGYIQLPADPVAVQSSAVATVRGLLNTGLLGRFDKTLAALPALADNAVMVLVMGNAPADRDTPDHRSARSDLLSVLASSIRADRPDIRVVIAGDEAGVDRLTEMVETGRIESRRVLDELLSIDPKLDYSDWRLEAMGVASNEPRSDPDVGQR